MAGTGRPRDDGRRPVGEEVEDREGAGEQRAGEPERGDLRAAEVADDCRVDEDVERLRCERTERRQREPQDLAVVRGAPHALSLTGRACCRGPRPQAVAAVA